MTNKIKPQDEYQTRLKRLAAIKENQIEPYPSQVGEKLASKEILNDFDQLIKENKSVKTAGRLRSLRLHGGSCFFHLEDGSGKIQAYLKADVIGEKNYRTFVDYFDVGDFLLIAGQAFLTKKGEPTILVNSYKLLTKSLLPLPEKWHGLKEVETRYRQRYLDLLSNQQVKEIFYKRSAIIQYIREFFIKEGFLEVETPILQTVASGAIARPFKTYHQALKTDLYLRIAPELYLKELIIGGFEKVFEVAKCFRNEGIDYAHNPEFTQIEFYWAYRDYLFLMDFMENFLAKLILKFNGNDTINYDDKEISFKPPYPRWDFQEVFQKFLEIDLDQHNDQTLAATAKKKGLAVEKFWGKGKIADELFKKFIRPKMINPTYLINHPIELSPLAKSLNGRQNYVERFQLIVGGKIELMNAFSELNDPLEQERRFRSQQELFQKGDAEVMTKDEEFVAALKYGLPPTAGLGLGIDRLVNLLTNTHNIREVVFFPILKPLD